MKSNSEFYGMKKKVAIIGANGVPPSYGGWDQLVEQFTKFDSQEYEFIVYCSYLTNADNRSLYNNALVRVIRLSANGFQSIPYDIISLFLASKECDIILMLGTSGAVAIPIFKLFGIKIIINIDGAEWKRGKWNFVVKKFLKFSEYVAVKFSTLVVADNIIISNYIASEYGVSAVTIGYGGDHAMQIPAGNVLREHQLSTNAYAFKVCRIVPENNIDMILSACLKENVLIVLVGNFNASEYGREIRRSFSNIPNIRLLDPIYAPNILDELRSNAGLYIHGHSVGGTNPSLVEAMNLGLNIAAYDVNYNRVTSNGYAHFFHSEERLREILVKWRDSTLVNLGDNAKNFANFNYSWSLIMRMYVSCFGFIFVR